MRIPGAVSSRPVAGGDISDAYAVELEDGRRVFVKTRAGASRDEFETEAAGLRWLAEPNAIRVPEVVDVGEDWLALEWIDSGRLSGDGEEELGRGLARLHAAGAPGFGGPRPLRIGALALPNGPEEEWASFYVGCRIEPLLRMARDRRVLSGADAGAVGRVCERMPELAGPPEPPARLHGDLWGGNVLPGADGRPWLIDPAAYGGHREVDLAMLRLFGAPSARTMRAYEEVAPLAEGHEERVALWQLFPLLVHAALFGGGYGSSAARAAKGYL